VRAGCFALALAMLVAACDTTGGKLFVDTDEALYGSLYPYYAELCAVSEFKKKPGFGVEVTSGGPGGHEVLYLNGACRDQAAGYPVLKLCDGATPAAGQGVGISVNAHYKNANWVATEGRSFFLRGDLGPTERLTRLAYQRTQARAQAMGILDGVEFHDRVFDDMPPGMSRRDYMYEVSIGTDYAVGFARDRYCARVPMDRDRMGRIVGYLNALNAQYRDGRQPFEVSLLLDSCAHLVHNALSAAGVWDEWPVDQFILFALFDFPVPKNEFVNLMRRTNDLPVGDLAALYRDVSIRQSLQRGDGLPIEAGALAESAPMIQHNDVYDTDVELIFYDETITGSYRTRFRRILSEPRYFDIAANLRHFAALYTSLKAAQKPVEWYFDAHPAMTPAERTAFAGFYGRFYQHIDQQSAAVEARLARLSAQAGR
jgi:hypothetical protein